MFIDESWVSKIATENRATIEIRESNSWYERNILSAEKSFSWRNPKPLFEWLGRLEEFIEPYFAELLFCD